MRGRMIGSVIGWRIGEWWDAGCGRRMREGETDLPTHRHQRAHEPRKLWRWDAEPLEGREVVEDHQ